MSVRSFFFFFSDAGVQTKGTATHGSSTMERVGAELVPGSYDVIASKLLPEIRSGIIPVLTGFIGMGPRQLLRSTSPGAFPLLLSSSKE